METEGTKNSVPHLPKTNINTHTCSNFQEIRAIGSWKEKGLSGDLICHLLVPPGHCLQCLLNSCF